MDASVAKYINQIADNMGELNTNMTEPRLYRILEDLISIVTIQERNISALEKQFEDNAENPNILHGDELNRAINARLSGNKY